MRLKQKERDAIAQAAREVFAPGAAVFLFGSRVDDAKQSGSTDPPERFVIWWVRCA